MSHHAPLQKSLRILLIYAFAIWMLARSCVCAMKNTLLCVMVLLPWICTPASATVQISSMTPSLPSPQLIGTSVTWSVTATDSNPGPLAFQFNVAVPAGSLGLARDFNVGVLSSGTWTATPFLWYPAFCPNTAPSAGGMGPSCQPLEGIYQIQVVIKDFRSGETTSKTVKFQVNPLVTGNTPTVVATANPLVALFSAPSCTAGSTMRVEFRQQSHRTAATTTNWAACHPPASMTFEIAGMYPNTTYEMFSQTVTGGAALNGPILTFATGTLPANIPFPSFKVLVPVDSATDTADSVILSNPVQFSGTAAPTSPEVATDLSGNTIWYYYANSPVSITVTRPLPNGTMLTLQSGQAWNPTTTLMQFLRQVDLVGNIVRETNVGAMQQQLLAMGATDGGPCDVVSHPAPVGSACTVMFSHDAIRSLPNGYTAILLEMEKIFPPGTQGDTSGLPVDIMGEMIVILDVNWHVTWYFDAFQHDGGAPQLDINRPAVRGETCSINSTRCVPVLLLGPGIAPLAKDWLHGNSLYYWPQNGDIIWSSRNQDWVMKIDYNNGSGTGNILWRMGQDGDFTFNNIDNDPWPWFSGQHDVGIQNNGAGPFTIFDNGATRVLAPPLGLGSGDSRGMALIVDETNMDVTPVLSADLGVYSVAGGSAQLLSDGNYFFFPPLVASGSGANISYSIELLPTASTLTGTQVLNIQGPEGYRAWRMPSLYLPPIT